MIPTRLADGAWTHRRRVDLAAQALARLAPHLPGLLTALKAVDIIVPPDMEAALGVTEGDLEGGVSASERRPSRPAHRLAALLSGRACHPAVALGTGRRRAGGRHGRAGGLTHGHPHLPDGS